MSPDERYLLASVSDDRVTFALTRLSGDIDEATVRSFQSAQQSTFTGAIQHYAGLLQFPLSNCQIALAVAGAVRGDTVRITNGRWFISLSGLRGMLGREPIVINDVSAIAWATLMLRSGDRRPLDSASAAPQNARARRAVVWVGDGVGAACLGYNARGHPFVMDGEAGHMTCATETEGERAALEDLRIKFGHLSYERALHALASDQVDSKTIDRASADRRALQVGVLGSFAGSVALAYGAWDGVYITGPQVARLLALDTAADFRSRFAAKGRFRNMLAQVPIWVIKRKNLALLGAAAFIRSERARSEAERHHFASLGCA